MEIQNIDINAWLNNNEAECLKQVHENWNKIPLLNVENPQELKVNKLVRFKGMIQDMFNPEFFYESYEVTNKETKQKRVQHGKYRDTAICSANEYIDFECKSSIAKDRQTFVVISPPGVNDWALNLEQELYLQKHEKSGEKPTISTSTKRSIDNDEISEDATMEVEETEASSKKPCTASKKSEDAKHSNKQVVSIDHLLNMPLPGRSGKACHLKVYEDNSIKLNDMIDCVGFLSMDGLYQEGDDCDTSMEETVMEMQTHHPPPSLIPRIHCVAFKPIIDCNPLYEEGINMSQQELLSIKMELEVVLTQLLMGDKLAAEYLIYHLISKVYNRMELMALGKFTYNISNIPVPVLPEYGAQIYGILEKLLSKSHYLPMSLDNMNDLAFVPKKDYDCDRITSGILQLTNNTHLVLDETKLCAGNLNASGVQAVGAIANIIKQQRTFVDFNYYKMDYDCDIAFLILSEGKSLLPSDFHVVLKPEDTHITTFEEILDAVNVYLKPELLTSIRKYLAHRRHAEYEITDNIHELVENEFVKMRANQNSTGEDLHTLLVLARYVCLAEGKSVLDEACWKRACELEQERKQRLSK